jgi:hypothetical protein
LLIQSPEKTAGEELDGNMTFETVGMKYVTMFLKIEMKIPKV